MAIVGQNAVVPSSSPPPPVNHTISQTSPNIQKNVSETSPVPYAAMKSFLAGAISGAVAKTAVAPFDRTKILMQVSMMYGWKRYRGSVFDSMRTIWNTEGFFGFFRGNSATVARIMPYSAIQYYSFEFYHRSLSEQVFYSDAPHPLKRFIAGAMAGCTSVIFTYPIDLARTVLAVQVSSPKSTQTVQRKGVFAALYTIAREQGISAIYRGAYPTIAGVVPYAGISFLSFGVLKRSADRNHVLQNWPVLTNLVCGASAGLSTFSTLHLTQTQTSLATLSCV